MDSIYYFTKALTFAWLLALFFIFLLGGNKSIKDDHFSRYIIMVTITFCTPLIKYFADTGQAAPGSFSWGYPFVSYLGFGLFFLGIFLHWTGIRTLNKQWSTVVNVPQDNKLVETGIYKYIRHPIYSALLLEFLGFGLMLSNWLAILGILLPNAASLAYRIFIEEKALVKYFGEAYVDYSRRVKRLIPGIF